MPEDIKVEVRELLLELRPVAGAVVAPAAYTNALHIVPDQNGFTVYFFAVPADVDSLESLKKELAGNSLEGKREPTATRLELPPLAKLFLPANVMLPFISALSQGYQFWLKMHGGSSNAPRTG